MPVHLKGDPVAEQVKWIKGDALTPETCASALKGADAVVICIGSPPLPTSSDEAMQLQRKMNGQTNVNVIQAAANAPDCAVKRIVVVGAFMPPFVPKGYRLGKLDAQEEAQRFASDAAAGRFS